MSYAAPNGGAVVQSLVGGYIPPNGGIVSQSLDGSDSGSSGGVALFRSVVISGQPAARRPSRACDPSWRYSRSQSRAARLPWRRSLQGSINPAVTGWRRVPSMDGGHSVAAWATPIMPRPRDVGSPWLAVDRRDHAEAMRHASSEPSDRSPVASDWLATFPADRGSSIDWLYAALPALIFVPPPIVHVGQVLQADYVAPNGASLSAGLQSGYEPPPGDDIGGSSILYPDPYVVRRADPARFSVVWGLTARRDAIESLRWGPGSQYLRPDPPPIDNPWTGSPNEPPPIPIARRVYIVMNDVSVVLLPDRTPIDVLSVDLNASVDSWAWTVRLELANPSQLALLKPGGDGPKLVEITMNSYVWTAIIEGRERNRVFSNASVTVTGRSQTALLSGDYTAARSKSFEDAYSAQQLANLEISERALPFTIDWRGLDWVVPGGVWYYQDLAPIDVIAQIAASRGAVLQSAPGDASLIVQSRYPISPWSWGVGNSDVALPIDWVTNVNAQQHSKPMYDAVIIAGQAQGVLAKVTRAASAGETFAPQVVDQLMVTPDVATERGRNVLSDRGVQEQVDMDIPLFAPGTVTAGMSGLYAPLLLVDVQDPADPWQGQTVGVSISARRGGPDNKALEIWQRVSLERHLSDAS